nr:hypothetical protein CFP56_50945 [Quercus suber]
MPAQPPMVSRFCETRCPPSSITRAHHSQNPSPHRFRKKPSGGQPSPNERPHARLRPPVPAEPNQGLSAPPPSTPRPRNADQFTATPRFAIGSRPRIPVPPSTATADLDASRPPLRTQLLRGKRAEDVEDSSPPSPVLKTNHQDEDDEMLELLPTSEPTDSRAPDHTNGGLHELVSSPKRRRIHPPFHADAATSSTVPAFHRPPQSPLPAAKPRFAPPRAPSPPPLSFPASTGISNTTHHRPPNFLRPVTTSENDPAEPLPETFSPHRRGQKFVPGGMAATLQTWVLETGQAAVQSRRGTRYARGEDFVFRGRVEEIFGGGGRDLGGPVTARAEGRNLLLAPRGVGAGEGLKVACMVGVRAPVWDVHVEGTNWTVAADWRVLSP